MAVSGRRNGHAAVAFSLQKAICRPARGVPRRLRRAGGSVVSFAPKPRPVALGATSRRPVVARPDLPGSRGDHRHEPNSTVASPRRDQHRQRHEHRFHCREGRLVRESLLAPTSAGIPSRGCGRGARFGAWEGIPTARRARWESRTSGFRRCDHCIRRDCGPRPAFSAASRCG